MTTRETMIVSAATLIRDRGVEATSFSDVIAHAGAPRGSIYHHFPGGKAELVEAATRYAGESTAADLAAALAAEDPVAAVATFARAWTLLLRESDFGAGCAVVSVAVDGDRYPAAREAAGEAFAAWERLIAEALAAHIPPERALSLATLVVAAIEGAVVIARARRSTAPVERVADVLGLLIGAAIGS